MYEPQGAKCAMEGKQDAAERSRPIRRPMGGNVAIRMRPAEIGVKMGRMTGTEEFISTLHVIAAAKGHTATVDAVFERFLRELQQSLGSDRQRIRATLEDLQRALTAEAQPTRSGPFAELQDHARHLVASWLRNS